MTKRKDELEHTIPWNDFELIQINGQKLCYGWENDEIVVYFPGGGALPLAVLARQKGTRIVPPQHIRAF